jgi:chromosome segregation ATPase
MVEHEQVELSHEDLVEAHGRLGSKVAELEVVVSGLTRQLKSAVQVSDQLRAQLQESQAQHNAAADQSDAHADRADVAEQELQRANAEVEALRGRLEQAAESLRGTLLLVSE